MNLINCHNHSDFSFDAKHPLQAMVDAAQNAGISVFAITDHCEINEYHDLEHPKPIVNSIAEVVRLREMEQYRNITLIAGVEIGQPLADDALVREVSTLPNLDYIIGSLHCVTNEVDYYYVDFTTMDVDAVTDLNRRYFAEMLDFVKVSDFDVLAHITYPFRYLYAAMKRKPGLVFSFNDYDEQVREVLRALVARGKSMEINTSTIEDLGNTTLDERFLGWFRELGGESVSIGTDAHNTGDVMRLLVEGHELVKKAGFTHTTYYQNRQPHKMKI